jgi:hypothetical protein
LFQYLLRDAAERDALPARRLLSKIGRWPARR